MGGASAPSHLSRMKAVTLFFDERSSPTFRTVFGGLLREADDVSVALTRIRLASLDFSGKELGQLGRLRLLLKELNAVTLHAEAAQLLRREHASGGIVRLLNRLRSGRIEVRVLPLGQWSPSFSVFRRDGRPRAVLTGAHRFSRDQGGGPLFASVHGPSAATRALHRYEALWARAHDVGPALDPLVRVAEGFGMMSSPPPTSAVGGRGPDEPPPRAARDP